MNEWIVMAAQPPKVEGYILFVPQEEPGEFYSGLAIPDKGYVLLARTDLSFSQILYWMPIPEIPEAP